MVKHADKKIYYSMGEVAEMFDLTPSLIRYWERQFDILKPRRNGKGNRLFTPEDVDNLKKIHYLVKTKGMTLKGAEQYLEERGEEVERSVQIVERLMKIRAVLQEIRDEMDVNSDDTVRELIIERSPESDGHIEKWERGREQPKQNNLEQSHNNNVQSKQDTEPEQITEEPLPYVEFTQPEIVVFSPENHNEVTVLEQDEVELLSGVLGSMMDGEDIDSEYISAIASELTPEEVKAAKEVMETIAEMEKADEKPKPQATVQTLF